MTVDLDAMSKSFAAEQNRCLDLGSRLASIESELRFKIEVLESELAIEKGKTNIGMTSSDRRLNGEYNNRFGMDCLEVIDAELFRLRDELGIFRNMYDENMRESEETLKINYMKRVRRKT